MLEPADTTQSRDVGSREHGSTTQLTHVSSLPFSDLLFGSAKFRSEIGHGSGVGIAVEVEVRSKFVGGTGPKRATVMAD